MKKCPNQAQNLAQCGCSYISCSRKGLCCECVLYHRRNNQIPGCFFSAESEKSYDRSVENYLRSAK